MHSLPGTRGARTERASEQSGLGPEVCALPREGGLKSGVHIVEGPNRGRPDGGDPVGIVHLDAAASDFSSVVYVNAQS